MSCTYNRSGDPSIGDSAHFTVDTNLRNQGSSPGLHVPPTGLIPNSDVPVSAIDDNLAFQSPHIMPMTSSTGPYNGPVLGSIRGTQGSGPLNGPAPQGLETLDFSDLDLFCPINADEISNRWLQSFMPVPGQKDKKYPANITTFIYRILKSYAAITVRGRGVPPFVHSSQKTMEAARRPLSTCLGLVRMCENPLPGSENSTVEVLQREMANIYEHHGNCDDLTLLSAFQAYLIYSLVLFFSLVSGSKSCFRQAMMNLQDLACSCSRQGLVSGAEQRGVRPKWEEWMVAEAKRRTLFTMYLFDSVLLAEEGLPTFLGSELRGLPAPGGMSTWKANTRREWEAAYNIYLAEWGGGGLTIDELWPIDEGLDEHLVSERRNRVDRWLGSVDEYGTMMYAVTSCTHGA